MGTECEDKFESYVNAAPRAISEVVNNLVDKNDPFYECQSASFKREPPLSLPNGFMNEVAMV